MARYFWYSDYIRNLERAPGKILLTDTRDVVFQSDPFSHETGDDLVCGLEPINMGACVVNREWYSHCYGNRNLEAMASFPVICSGVTMGSRKTILCYLEEMCAEILRRGRKIVRANGYDQSIHNHLLRHGLLEDHVRFSTAKDALIATLHHVDVENEIELGSDDLLRNKEGDLISIIHQYDRHPELEKAVMHRFGSRLDPTHGIES